MQPKPWQEYFPALTFRPHIGQRKAFEHAANALCTALLAVLLVLPTGYGKTRVAIGWYGIRRGQGYVNRVLWLVASDEQREQLSPTPVKKNGRWHRDPTISDQASSWFGLPFGETIIADGSPRSVKMHQYDKAEIFIATYQQLREQRAYFQQLMADAGGRWRWLVVGDEAHHLGEKGSWADWMEDRLPRAETVYMSATPIRTDRIPLKHVPSDVNAQGKPTYKALVEVPWGEAINEHAIRCPRAKPEEWQLEFEDKHGKLITLTTTQLRDLDIENGEQLDAWAIKHELRYTMTYLHGLIRDAITRLNEKRVQWPGQHQMIVFAMSQNHAKFLARSVFGEQGILGAKADWIGVNRSDKENRDVINQFKGGDLEVLIQVDKVGEGFDHPACSVGLFLNHFTSETKILQQLGRLLRRLFDISPELDIADIFADTSHPVHDVVRAMKASADSYRDPRDTPGNGGGTGSDWPYMPEMSEITAKWLATYEVWPEGFDPPEDGAPGYGAGIMRAAEQFRMPPEQVQAIVYAVKGEEPQAVIAPGGEVGRQAMMQDRVDRATRMVASDVIRLTAQNGGHHDPKRLAGQIKKNINAMWKSQGMGHDAMLSDDFERKYEWLRYVHVEMGRTRTVPAWLTRSW
jgi:superfamily II DNA or RNA helicase